MWCCSSSNKNRAPAKQKKLRVNTPGWSKRSLPGAFFDRCGSVRPVFYAGVSSAKRGRLPGAPAAFAFFFRCRFAELSSPHIFSLRSNKRGPGRSSQFCRRKLKPGAPGRASLLGLCKAGAAKQTVQLTPGHSPPGNGQGSRKPSQNRRQPILQLLRKKVPRGGPFLLTKELWPPSWPALPAGA